MNASRRREIEKIFDYFDRDHSQTLDAEEMLEFLTLTVTLTLTLTLIGGDA